MTQKCENMMFDSWLEKKASVVTVKKEVKVKFALRI